MMPIVISDYASVIDRAAQLGCVVPEGIAALPANFGTATDRKDLQVLGETTTIATLFRNEGLELGSFLPKAERPEFVHNKSFDWAMLLFISASVLTNDPNAVSVALGIVSNYLTEFFKGQPSKQVKLSVVVEKRGTRTFKQLTYEGDVSGLSALKDAIKKIADE